MTMQTETFFIAASPPPRSDQSEPAATEALIERLEHVPTRVRRDGDIFFLEYEHNAEASVAAVAAARAAVEAMVSSRTINYTGKPTGEVWRESGNVLQLPTGPNLLEQYQQAGWHLLALEGKKCLRKAWQDPSTGPDMDFHGKNVGVLLGMPSGNLGDVDLDGDATNELAAIVFAELPASGRASKPYSHRWFRFADSCKTEKFKLTAKQLEAIGGNRGEMLVEVRGDKAQTMIPRSGHPSGERVEWTTKFDPEPPILPHEEVLQRAAAVAALAVISWHWPKEGTRDDAALALCGALARLDWVTAELADRLVGKVAELGGDANCGKDRRDNKAAQTFARLESGDETTGLETLFALCGIEGTLKRTLRAWLSGSQEHEQPEGSVYLCEGELVRIVDACEAALCDVYQRDAQLVRVCVRRDLRTEQRVVGDVKVGWLREYLCRQVTFVRRAKSGGYCKVDLPYDYANTLMNRGEWPVPVLRTVVQTPVLMPDGSVINEPGYHANVGLYFDGEPFAGIPVSPTHDDAKAALRTLSEPFSQYRFAHKEGVAVMLSAVLSTLARNLLAAVPAHGIDASVAGSGKGKAARAIATICTGVPPMTINLVPSQDENDKRVATALFSATPLLLIDNISEPFGGDLLCSVATEPVVTVRKLGAHTNGTITNTTTLLLTGNNLVAAGDMSRRVVMARIDPGVANPHDTQFPFDPARMAGERRREFVVAALTVLRAYLQAGEPNRPKPIGSFEDWSLIRGALLWCGERDPADSMQRVLDADPERENLRRLLKMWHGAYKEKPMQLNEVTNEDLVTLLMESACDGDKFNSLKVAKWLRRFEGRVLDDLVLTKRARKGRAAEYRVQPSIDQQGLL